MDNIMNKKIVSGLVALFLATFSLNSAFAGPPPGGWNKLATLSSVEDFQGLKSGDKIAQVCKMCDSISITEVQSNEQAMQFCKEGSKLDCPSCDNVAKVVRVGPPSKGTQNVRFVDDHGNTCMIMAKVETEKSSKMHEHKKH
jgi:hypothetical protein